MGRGVAPPVADADPPTRLDPAHRAPPSATAWGCGSTCSCMSRLVVPAPEEPPLALDALEPARARPGGAQRAGLLSHASLALLPSPSCSHAAHLRPRPRSAPGPPDPCAFLIALPSARRTGRACAPGRRYPRVSRPWTLHLSTHIRRLRGSTPEISASDPALCPCATFPAHQFSPERRAPGACAPCPASPAWP